VFDGLHLGHQEVICSAIHAAKQHGGLSGVLTFHPHPASILHPSRQAPASLCHPETRDEILSSLGLDLLILLPFTPALAAVPANDFILQLLNANVRTIAVGEDWRFGHNRSGDTQLLQSFASSHPLHVIAVPPVRLHSHRISSTRIRQTIAHGDFPAANEMLGRTYSVRGTVTHGAQLARSLGFPTANINPGNTALPPDGVWIVKASSPLLPSLHGVANLGCRPTVNGYGRLLETHLFDFSANLYDLPIEVSFLHHLRKEIKFPNLEALQHQILNDCAVSRAWLASHQYPIQPQKITQANSF